MRAVRQVLFGVVAMQMNFIDRQSLIEGLRAWSRDKSRPLGEILVERESLDAGERELLEALVDKQIGRNADDETQSLASLSSIGSLREEIVEIGDEELTDTLPYVAVGRPQMANTVDYSLLSTSIASSREHRSMGDQVTRSSKRFSIVRPHASGGLGKVSIAVDEELSREVALKEIKEQFAHDPQSQARFLLEGEITGGLEHPGIVPVYSLGCYPDGRPYYAMRLIRGESLRDNCNQFHEQFRNKRGQRAWLAELRKLLDRFRDTCNAIEYAHSRGVIHRDLKPANIMLGRFGETLVVDWGLAKLLAEDECAVIDDLESMLRPPAHGNTDSTQFGIAIGTLAYMSPEQAAGRLDLLGPTTDVYGLGATLYHMLTGHPPFRRETDDEDLRLRVIQCEFPRPRSIERRVPKELEAICLKAMSRSTRERYRSVRELSEDVEHYLAGEPIAAYPRRFHTYLRQKTRVRKAAPLVAIVLACAVLVWTLLSIIDRWPRDDDAAIATILKIRSLQLSSALARANSAIRARVEEKQARERAESELAELRQRNEALLQTSLPSPAPAAAVLAPSAPTVVDPPAVASKSDPVQDQQVAKFFIGMFQGADPIRLCDAQFASWRPTNPNLTAREIIDLAAESISQDAGIDPVLRASLLDHLASAYLGLADYNTADRLIQEALEIRRRELGPDNPLVADSLSHAGTLRFLLGYRDEAEQKLTEALAIYDRVSDSPTFDQSTAHLMLAWALSDGNRQNAKAMQDHAAKGLRIREDLQGSESRDIAVAYLVQAYIDSKTGSMSDALGGLVKASEAMVSLPGGEHVRNAVLKNQSLVTALASDRNEAAARYAREAAHEIGAAFGNDSPLGLALITFLASFVALNSPDSLVVNELFESVDSNVRSVWKGHPRLAQYLEQRADASEKHDGKAAKKYYEEAAVIYETLASASVDSPTFERESRRLRSLASRSEQTPP